MGVLGGVAAGAFDRALVVIGELTLGSAEPAVAGIEPVRVLLATAATSLAAGLIGVLGTRRGRPQGIGDVIAAVRTREYPLDAREGLTGAVASALAVGGGQSAGREGPTAQLAASIAATVCDRPHVPRTTARTLIAAAAGAGIAASFNSPLGGAFFAMENLLGNFALEAFAPVVVASVVGTVVGQALLGDRLAVALPPMDIGHPIELVAYPALGVACGLVAIAFRASTRVAADALDRLPGPKWLRPLVPGLIAGGFAALGLHQVMGNGYGFVRDMIQREDATLELLLLVVAAKIVASAFAVAAKSGGMFAATMFLGAVTGELVGAAFQTLFPHQLPSRAALAAVGMGGVAAAVARVRDVMTARVTTIAADAPIASVAAKFLGQRTDEVFVVHDGRLVGQVDIQDVKALLAAPEEASGTARSLARVVPALRLDDRVADAMERFFRAGTETLPVVDDKGRLLGSVAERDLVGALNREILRRDVLMARIAHGPADKRETDFLELPEGYTVEVVGADGAVGRTLRDLALPRREGVTVLALDLWDEARQQHVRSPPRQNYALGARDRLVMMGPIEKLRKLSLAIPVDPEPTEPTARKA
jgi:CIC family chloride channel protein